MRLKDKVAIVTGAGSGMGRATALKFAKEGAKVVVADINDQNGQAVVEEIKALGGEAVYVHANVADENEIKNMIDTAVQNFGKLDILHNNAGFPQVNKPFDQIPVEEWMNCHNINTKAIFLAAKYALPELKKTKGVILNTLNTGCMRPRAGSAAYASSKGGALILTQVLASELGEHGIRVNAVCPGPTQTPMFSKFMGREVGDETFKEIAGTIPLGRMIQPEDIANAALFLVSDEAAAISGVALVVDGGQMVSRKN